ncbi:MAG: putative Amidohydrolase 3 [Acidobacteriaceae bacterium]|nr:putative Amidohydrolase 3 [Acidobacteriaceae bacterium]
MLIKGFRANATDLVLALSASLVLSVSLDSFAQPASAQQGSVASSETDAAPDLVLVHGRVLTVDAHDSIAQALAIKAGKIVEVGTDSSVTSLIGKDTHVIDLHGLTVTPGLIDSHATSLREV